MSTFNYAPNLFLGNTERKSQQKFLGDEGYKRSLVKNMYSPGIIREKADTNFDSFRVKVGTNPDTIKITRDSFALNHNGEFIFQKAFDNLLIPSVNTWYWVKCTYAQSTVEEGTVSIASDGTLTGFGTSFTQRLRGGKYFPSKIKINSSTNTGEYTVVEVINNANLLLSGSFNPETNMTYSIIGTFTPDSIQTSDEKYPFRYDSCDLEFIPELSLDEEPSLPVDGSSFFIARVRNVAGVVSVQDKRSLFYKTKTDFDTSFISTLLTNIIGVEAVKYQSPISTREKNIIELSWAFRSSNWTVESSLNRLTLSSGQGGIYKQTSDFVNGAFDGWHVYLPSGKFIPVVSSELSSTQINLTLEYLNPSDFVSGQVLVCPPVEEVELNFTPSSTETQFGFIERKFTFPVNTSLAIIELILVKSNNTSYNIKYRYKNNKTHNEWTNIPNDSAGYYNESSFDANGILNSNPIDRTRVPYTSGNITLNLATNSYFKKITAVQTGDLFGVDILELDASTENNQLIVGTSKKEQIITTDGQVTLTGRKVINLLALGAQAGNQFLLTFKADILKDSNNFLLVNDWDGAETITTGMTLLDFDDFYLNQSKNDNLFVRCTFDGTNWIANILLGEIKKTRSWIEPTLLNGWEKSIAAVYSSSAQPRYVKIQGIVYLKGRFFGANATANPVFNLPVGFRPDQDIADINNDWVLRTNGDLDWVGGSYSLDVSGFSLDISFPII